MVWHLWCRATGGRISQSSTKLTPAPSPTIRRGGSEQYGATRHGVGPQLRMLKGAMTMRSTTMRRGSVVVASQLSSGSITAATLH
eukprot:3413689-Amphidinium_carterae.1